MEADEVKRRLSALGYVWQDADAWLLSFCMEKAEAEVRSACGITELPEDLRCAVVDMACGEFLFSKRNGAQGAAEAERVVKSVTEGDASVTFVDDATPEQCFDRLVASLRKLPEAGLIRYRRLTW